MRTDEEFTLDRFNKSGVITRWKNQNCVDVFFDGVEESDGEYQCTVYSKRRMEDDDCACEGEDPDCLCNWNYELEVKVTTSVRDLINTVVAESNKILRCRHCTQSMTSFDNIRTCTACFMQELVDEKLPMNSECPVCLEAYPVTQEHKLSCKHSMCVGCFKRLDTPKRCPLCRAPS